MSFTNVRFIPNRIMRRMTTPGEEQELEDFLCLEEISTEGKDNKKRDIKMGHKFFDQDLHSLIQESNLVVLAQYYDGSPIDLADSRPFPKVLCVFWRGIYKYAELFFWDHKGNLQRFLNLRVLKRLWSV